MAQVGGAKYRCIVMKTKGPTRFDLAAIRRQAGGKTFERGKEYFEDDCVEILSLEPKRVIAQVAGTEDYRTVVTVDGKEEYGGECSCPAFGDFGFCKHMVAAALAANAVKDDSEAAGVVPRLREHLQANQKINSWICFLNLRRCGRNCSAS